MSLVSDYATFLRKRQKMHPAWPPLVSAVNVGDYGVFHDGVFVRFGSIRDDFGVDPQLKQAPSAALDLQSNGTLMVRLQGGAAVPAYDLLDIDAELQVHFEDQHSFLVKAQTLDATEMASIQTVAASLQKQTRWRKKWKVVSKVFQGESVTVVATEKAKTNLSFKGKAKALAALEQSWTAFGGIDFAASSTLALEFVGRKGPVGLELFKLSFFSGEPVPKNLSRDTDGVSVEDAWDSALSNDV